MATRINNLRLSGLTEAGLVLGFIVLVAVFLLSAFVSYRNVQTIISSNDAVLHTTKVQVATERVALSLNAAESAVRGFVLTGDNDYATKMEAQIGDSLQELSAVKTLTSDNASQQSRLARLDPIVSEKIAAIRDGVARRRAEGDKFLERTKSGKGKLLMAEIEGILQDCRNEEASLMELRLQRSQESVRGAKVGFWISTVAGLGSLCGFFVMVERLLRSQKANRLADQKRSQELEDLVRQRTIDLQSAYKEMESFSYTVSHDLRAPLRGMSGFAHILNREISSGISEEHRDMLNRIVNNATRMAELIDALLQLSRVANGAISGQPIDLSHLSREVAEELKNGFKVSIEPDLKAIGDERLIRDLLRNLISNAIKYACPGRPYEITIGSIDSHGGKAFFVRDNGMGFIQSQAERIFQPFTRMHTDPQIQGTGIGLATCAKIVMRHGGSIWAESSPNVGSTFYFTLTAERDLLISSSEESRVSLV